jgi:hypothetical protein
MFLSKDHAAQAAQHRLSLVLDHGVFFLFVLDIKKFLPAEGSDLQLMHDRSLNFYRLFLFFLKEERLFSQGN